MYADPAKPCVGCGKPTPHAYMNWCSWDCQVETATREGGVRHTPNGLPVRCIRHDNMMMECEHGDHPSYLFPVKIRRLGEEYTGIGEDGYSDYPQTQALIFVDGSVALTLYECNWAIWSVRSGECLGGRYQNTRKDTLDVTSREAIVAYLAKKETTHVQDR